MKTFAFAAAAIGLAFISTPAFADPSQNRAVQVEFEDLNLDTPSGQKHLDRRIHRAARSVCGVDDIRTSTRIRNSAVYKCYAKAVSSAKSQVAAMIEDQQRGG